MREDMYSFQIRKLAPTEQRRLNVLIGATPDGNQVLSDLWESTCYMKLMDVSKGCMNSSKRPTKKGKLETFLSLIPYKRNFF